MSDDLTKRKQDSMLISLEEPYEVENWMESLKCSEHLLRVLVGKVGHSAKDVRTALDGLRAKLPGANDDELADAVAKCGINNIPCIRRDLGLERKSAPSFGMGM